MKKRQIGRLLSVALSAALTFTSVIPSYAMEGVDGAAPEASEEVSYELEETVELAEAEEEVTDEIVEAPEGESAADDELIEDEADSEAIDDTGEDDLTLPVGQGEEEIVVEPDEAEKGSKLFDAAGTLPTAYTIVQGFDWATLEDRPYEGETKIDPVISPEGKESWFDVTGGDSATLYLVGNELKKHRNAEGTAAYWYGAALDRRRADITGYDLTIAYGFAKNHEDGAFADDEYAPASEFIGETGGSHYVFYGGSISGKELGNLYVSLRYAQEGEIVKTYTFLIDVSGVKTVTLPDAQLGLVTAPLVDRSETPVTPLYDDDTYQLGEIVQEDNNISVPISVNNLVKHKAGNGVIAYWVGFGIPKVEKPGVKTWFVQSYEEKVPEEIEAEKWKPVLDDVWTQDDVTFDTVYFDAGELKDNLEKGYVYVKYTDGGRESVFYTYAVDVEGVELKDGLPKEAPKDVIAAKLHDNSGQNPIPDDQLYTSYKVTGDYSGASVGVEIEAKGLKKHMAGNGQMGYWVGFGIPRNTDPTIKTSFLQSYTFLENPEEVDGWLPRMDGEMTVGEGADAKTYDTVYFNAADSRLPYKLGFVYVMYTSTETEDSVIFQYAVSMSGVEIGDLPTIDEAKEVVAPTLEDHPKQGEEKITELYDAESYKAECVDLLWDILKVKLSAKNLRAHRNGNGTPGYWAGVAFYWPKRNDPGSNVSMSISMSTTDPINQESTFYPVDQYTEEQEPSYVEDGKKYIALYYDVSKADVDEDGDKYVYAGIRYSDGADENTFYYVINVSDITLHNDFPEASEMGKVEVAPLDDRRSTEEGKIPSEELSTGYAIKGVESQADFDEYSQFNVDVKADSLIVHQAGNGHMGYWAGIAIPEIVSDNFTVSYAQQYSYDPETIRFKDALDDVIKDDDGKITYRTVYFDTASDQFDLVFDNDDGSKITGKFGHVFVKYEFKGYPSVSKTYHYLVNFENVGAVLDIDTSDVVTADLKDYSEVKKDPLYDADTYTVVLPEKIPVISGNIYDIPIEVTAENLVQHTEMAGGAHSVNHAAYWAGIGLPQSLRLGRDVKYYYSEEYPDFASISEADWKPYDQFFVGTKTVEEGVDAVTYDTDYYEVDSIAGTDNKRYVTARVIVGSLETYLVYALDFSKVTLKKTAYDIAVTEKTNTFGRIVKTTDKGEVSLKASVGTSSEKGLKVPAKGVAVRWYSSNEKAAYIKEVASDYTDDKGEVTATVLFTGEATDAEVVYITAVAEGESSDIVGFVIYAFDESQSKTVTMDLPGESEYAIAPAFTIPDRAGLGLKWESSDPETVEVDSDGIAIAKKNGKNINVSQGIVDEESGKYIDKYGATEVTEGLLKTPEGFFNFNVTTNITEITITQEKDIYANAQKVEQAFRLDIYPETFDWSDVTEITWSSSNPAVATVEICDDDAAYADITPGMAKGATNIKVVVKTATSTFNVSYTLRVKPTADNIIIRKQGSDEKISKNEGNISSNPVYIKRGNVAKLYTEVTAIDPDTDTSVIWAPATGEYISVSDTGMVTAYAVTDEPVEVTATTPDGTSDTTWVMVYDDITEMSISMDSVVLESVGDQVTLTAMTAPVGASGDFAWSIDNTEVAVLLLGENGTTATVKAVGVGDAAVTLEDKATGLKAKATITVGDGAPITPATKITAEGDKTDVTLSAGESRQLLVVVEPEDYTNTVFEYTCPENPYVSVDKDYGIVYTDKNIKEVVNETVTVQAYKVTGKLDEAGAPVKEKLEGVKVDFRVAVIPLPDIEYVSVHPGNLTLTAPLGGFKDGEMAQLVATTYPAEAPGYVVWTSDDESIASVNSSTGVVEAVSSGITTICATTYKDYDANTQKYSVQMAMQTVEVTVIGEVADDDIETGRYVEDGVWIGAIPDYIYSGTAIKPTPNVYYGTVLLTENVDYTYAYKNNVNAARAKNKPTVTVKLKGNYSGTVSQEFAIDPADLYEYAVINNVSAPVKASKKTASGYAEQFLKPVITFGGKTLKAGTDYELLYLDDTDWAYEAVGNWGITIVGKGNFCGETYAEEFLIDPAKAFNISGATVTGIEKAYTYKGEPIVPENIKVNYKGTELTENVHYEVRIGNNNGIGTGTVFITGLFAGDEETSYYGTKKVNFKINPDVVDLSTAANIKVSINGVDSKENPTLPYVKGGAKPSWVKVELETDDGAVELNSSDFSWSSKVGANAVGKDVGTVTIKGKGKFYKGSKTFNYSVEKQDIGKLMIVTEDFLYSTKAKAYEKNKITVYDLNGKTLGKKDFTVKMSAPKDVPQIYDVVNVEIKAAEGSCYTGSLITDFRVIDKACKLSSATYAFKVGDEEIAANKYYVKYKGTPVNLYSDDIVLKVKKKVGRTTTVVTLDPSDYEVVAIYNNNKVGSATVIVKGTGEFGGTKTIKFKITK